MSYSDICIDTKFLSKNARGINSYLKKKTELSCISIIYHKLRQRSLLVFHGYAANRNQMRNKMVISRTPSER